MAKGYIFASISVTDPERYAIYRERVPGVVAQFGGSYLIRGGAAEQLEGPAILDRLVVIEFESVAAAQRFYRSEDYAPLLAMREESTRSHLAIVEGVG